MHPEPILGTGTNREAGPTRRFPCLQPLTTAEFRLGISPVTVEGDLGDR